MAHKKKKNVEKVLEAERVDGMLVLQTKSKTRNWKCSYRDMLLP